ncbi:MAG: CpaE family protein [Pseudomonadota bacterium]
MSMNAPQEDIMTQQENDEFPQTNLGDVRPIPRITIQCFCETEGVRQTLETAAGDRRMARTHTSVNLGGIPGAVEYYATAPTPNLIVIESRQTGDALMSELERLAGVCDADTRVVVIGHFNDILMYRELMANGISEYLVAPVTMADIMSSISNVFMNEETGPIGKVFAFIGSKGGCGSSTICHNIAWSISSTYRNEVVLADLDLAFGTANMNLDQDPTQGIADAVFSPDRIDDILLDRLLAKCAEHLSLLAAPSTLERTYDFDAQAFSAILEIAQKNAPCVIVDIPNQWNGWTKQVLAAADEVIVTAEPELANLRNAKNLVDTITEIRPNDAMPRLVMNRVGVPKRPEIAVADFSNAIGIEPSAVIPFEPALFGVASNNGQMISEADPKSAVVEMLMNLTQILTGKAEVKSAKKSPFDFLKGIKRNKK